MLRILLTGIILLTLSSGICSADSLANEQSATPLYLYQSRIATHVGDEVTIVIEENTTSTAGVTGKREKGSEIGLNDTLNIPSGISLFGALFGQLFNSKTKYNNSYSTTTTQTFTSTLACRVIEVQRNGDLVVEGSKSLLMNNEAHFVKIRGIIRPIDITADNTISSTKVANAELICDGLGKHSNRNRSQGVFQQFLRIFY